MKMQFYLEKLIKDTFLRKLNERMKKLFFFFNRQKKKNNSEIEWMNDMWTFKQKKRKPKMRENIQPTFV